jgi:hypothetical protein
MASNQLHSRVYRPDDSSDNGLSIQDLLNLLTSTTDVSGTPSLACTECFESAVDAQVSETVAMNGCAQACVGTQIVTEGETPLDALSALSSVMDPTILEGLFTNAYDNGILGMYELVTQLLMKGVGYDMHFTSLHFLCCSVA